VKISIEDNEIVTKTYQQKLNLNRYITPLSDHPPKMIQGIIYSLLQKYKQQNTQEEDYLEMALNLYHCHARRGYRHIEMKRHIILVDMRMCP
jgi:hypothetical protein